MITALLNKRTDGATSFIAPKRAGWKSRLVGVSRGPAREEGGGGGVPGRLSEF